MAQTASFSSDRTGECTEVLTLDGRCDKTTAVEAEQRIRTALDAGRSEIIFDLRGVIALSPAMFAMLSRGAIEAKARDGHLRIIRPNVHVWAQFEENGLGRVFASFTELSAALS